MNVSRERGNVSKVIPLSNLHSNSYHMGVSPAACVRRFTWTMPNPVLTTLFIHSFIQQYVLNIYPVSDSMQDTEDRV